MPTDRIKLDASAYVDGTSGVTTRCADASAYTTTYLKGEVMGKVDTNVLEVIKAMGEVLGEPKVKKQC